MNTPPWPAFLFFVGVYFSFFFSFVDSVWKKISNFRRALKSWFFLKKKIFIRFKYRFAYSVKKITYFFKIYKIKLFENWCMFTPSVHVWTCSYIPRESVQDSQRDRLRYLYDIYNYIIIIIYPVSFVLPHDCPNQ